MFEALEDLRYMGRFPSRSDVTRWLLDQALAHPPVELRRLAAEDLPSRDVSVEFPPDLIEQLDDFRFARRIPSRAEAIRMLLRIGLGRTTRPVERTGTSGIREDDTSIVIGGLTTHAELESSSVIREHCPLLADAAARVGDELVRRLGVIGGWLAYADPDLASDYPVALLALRAEVIATGPLGSRTIKIDDYVKEPLGSVLRSDETLSELRVPRWPSGTGMASAKASHPTTGEVLLTVAVALTTNKKRMCTRASIGAFRTVGNRAQDAETALIGKRLSASTLVAAAAKASTIIILLLPEPYRDLAFFACSQAVESALSTSDAGARLAAASAVSRKNKKERA